MPTKITYSLFRNERCVRMTRVNLNEGKKYDATQVSQEGISQEELKAAEEKARKLIDIYNTDQKGGLSSLELALAMDGFTKAAGENGKLSRKEMKNYANELNQKYGLAGDDAIEVKDLKSFLKFVKEATKGDTKVSTQEVINKDIAARTQAEALEKARKEAQARLEAENKAKQEEEARALQESKERAAAEAEKQRLATPSKYTVQPGEKLNDLLARSLKAQGKEVNDETLAEAKAEFIKNNPNALHGQKGKEYLYMGDVVKIAGGLEDKANAEEVKAQYRASIQAAKPEVKKEEKPEDKGKSLAWEDNPKVKSAREEAVKKGYSATEDPDVFRDNKTGRYWGVDAITGGLIPREGVTKYNKDGSHTVTSVLLDNRQKLVNKDKNGNVTSIQLRNYTGKSTYTDPKFVAERTGLKQTLHSGTYYDSASKTHMVWDAKTHSFKALQGVKSVAANGMQFDKNGNSINPKGYRMMKDGSIKKHLSKNNLDADVTYTFYPSGRVETITIMNNKLKGYNAKTFIKYADKPADEKGYRYYSRAQTLMPSIEEKYGFQHRNPDKLI